MTSRSFPFLGAGEASYLEWAHLDVVFVRAPTAEEKQRIVATVPPPLCEVRLARRCLSLGSEQGVGRWIEACYGAKKAPVKKLTTASRFKMAQPARVTRFNADIERWLDEAHAIVPVYVAVRVPDGEAGGTELSDWHVASIARASELLGELASTGAEGRVRKAIERMVAAARGPTSAQRVHQFMMHASNAVDDKRALATALQRREALTSDEDCWRAAAALADIVMCFPDRRLLQTASFRALVAPLFQRATAALEGFQVLAAEGTPASFRANVLACAVERALRDGEPPGQVDDVVRERLARRADQLGKDPVAGMLRGI